MRALPQATEIIFEVQRKRSNERIKTTKNKLFSLQNTIFFPYLWTPPTFKPHNFLIHFKQFKML
jgi:hypothetical protein